MKRCSERAGVRIVAVTDSVCAASCPAAQCRSPKNCCASYWYFGQPPEIQTGPTIAIFYRSAQPWRCGGSLRSPEIDTDLGFRAASNRHRQLACWATGRVAPPGLSAEPDTGDPFDSAWPVAFRSDPNGEILPGNQPFEAVNSWEKPTLRRQVVSHTGRPPPPFPIADFYSLKARDRRCDLSQRARRCGDRRKGSLRAHHKPECQRCGDGLGVGRGEHRPVRTGSLHNG